MFQLNDDLSIYVTRGDAVYLTIKAKNNGEDYTFRAGEVLRIKVFGKKNCENVVLEKDFPVVSDTAVVDIILEKDDTKFGEVISKPTDYWYEVELNPDTDTPQTIIGYDDDGAKLFKLYPEGADIPAYVPAPEDIAVIDDELDMTSDRPVRNRVIAQAFENLKYICEKSFGEVAEVCEEALGVCEQINKSVSALFITPQMFGAVGDGVTNDTEAIKSAVGAIKDGARTLRIPCGTYLVDEDITLVSDMTLEGEGFNSIIKRIGADNDHYNVIACNGTDNVTIKNIHIMGERAEHIGTEGEWGMCIGLRGCNNTTILNCKLTDAWGDGVYLGTGDNKCCSNTIIEGCIIDNNRRQGISVINSNRLVVRGCTITNTNGINPEGGIDFEANYDTDISKNNIVESCIFYGNNGGSIIVGNYIVPYEIVVKNCTSSDKKGLSTYGVSECAERGYLTVQNCNFRNVTRCIAIEDKSATGLFVRITNCELYVDGNIGVCIEYTSDRVVTLGGLRVYGCSLNNPNNTSNEPIRIMNNTENGTYNDIIIDVVAEDCKKYSVYTQCSVTGSAIVKMGKKRTLSSSFTLDKYAVFDSVDVKCESADKTITCKESFPYNCPVTIRKIPHGDYKLIIKLDDNSAWFPQRPGYIQIYIQKGYEEITLVHESQNVWSIKDATTSGVSFV